MNEEVVVVSAPVDTEINVLLWATVECIYNKEDQWSNLLRD